MREECQALMVELQMLLDTKQVSYHEKLKDGDIGEVSASTKWMCIRQ